ncbi:unnamed protein product [Ilex paraguariensis]|uniref:Uncharacterized protein n=1 Tax=Ilex paraguariensis TaxID=185542 RepID=A0ABC8TV04_9AQUA
MGSLKELSLISTPGAGKVETMVRLHLPADKISEIDQPTCLVRLFFSIEKESRALVCSNRGKPLYTYNVKRFEYVDTINVN